MDIDGGHLRRDVSTPEVRAVQRFAGMEGLRGLAAISIVVHHCGRYAVDGGTVGNRVIDASLRHLSAGVLLFFTLSGLLLYRPFVVAIVDGRSFPPLRRYGRNRLFRIAPAYWVILLLTGAVLGATIVPDGPRFLTVGYLTDPGLLASNLLLLQNYRPSTFLTGIGPSWTLVIELAFYVSLPVVSALAFWLAARVRPSRRPLVTLLPPGLFLVAGLLGKLAVLLVVGHDDSWGRSWAAVASRSFVANADLFSFGMVVAVASVLHANGSLRLPARWRPAVLVAAAAGVVLTARVPGGALGTFRYDVLAALTSALVVAALVIDPDARRSRALRVLEHRVLTAAGLISYSLYLWHEPLIHWLVQRDLLGGSGLAGLGSAVAVVGAIAGALAALTYVAVERPALRHKVGRGPGWVAGHR